MISTIAITGEGLDGIEKVAEELGFKSHMPIVNDRTYSCDNKIRLPRQAGGFYIHPTLVNISVLNPARLADADDPCRKYLCLEPVHRYQSIREKVGEEVNWVIDMISGQNFQGLDRLFAEKLAQHYSRAVLFEGGID